MNAIELALGAFPVHELGTEDGANTKYLHHHRVFRKQRRHSFEPQKNDKAYAMTPEGVFFLALTVACCEKSFVNSSTVNEGITLRQCKLTGSLFPLIAAKSSGIKVPICRQCFNSVFSVKNRDNTLYRKGTKYGRNNLRLCPCIHAGAK